MSPIFSLVPISKDDILKIVKLARLELSTEELEKFYHDLAQIVSYVEQIQKINTDGIAPGRQFLQVENVFRKDIVKPSLPREKALANVPDSDGEFIRVPRVL